MQHLFIDTRPLDARARESFSLTEDFMMECAASALEKEVESATEALTKSTGKHILILAGSGNNGGDGYILARLLAQNDYEVTVCVAAVPKSDKCKLQKSRCEHLNRIACISIQDLYSILHLPGHGITFPFADEPFSIIVDCIFGSGFYGGLPAEIESIVDEINKVNAVKIACDVPSGIDQLGNAAGAVFRADVTVTMGAQKICLYSDRAKDYVGKVHVADLGIPRCQFENVNDIAAVAPMAELLEPSDMILPHRNKQNVNKGSFGHVAIVAGEKPGAAVIAGSSAFRFGAGLVTLIGKNSTVFPGKEIVLNDDGQLPRKITTEAEAQIKAIVPYDLMCSEMFPVNTTAVAMGMGLGRDGNASTYFEYLGTHADIPCVLDADIFYSDALCAFLKTRTHNVVLTPHPKEFVSLLQKCNLGMYTVSEAVDKRIELVQRFCEAFPGIVLLLKGAVITIGVKLVEEGKVRLYLNPYGTNALAKGGSGDVLAGMIASLLAQRKILFPSTAGSIDAVLAATISASLAHAIASSHAPCDYALTPFSLMKLVSEL